MLFHVTSRFYLKLDSSAPGETKTLKNKAGGTYFKNRVLTFLPGVRAGRTHNVGVHKSVFLALGPASRPLRLAVMRVS